MRGDLYEMAGALSGLADIMKEIAYHGSGAADIVQCADFEAAGCGNLLMGFFPIRKGGQFLADAGRLFRRTPDAVKRTPSGGAGPVRVGQAGENAVRGAYDIGPKATVNVNGRTRIFDGLTDTAVTEVKTDTAVTEVKNVSSLSYTQQLKDSLSYAQATGRGFDLYVRPDTYLSGPLRDAIARGDIALRFIP